MMDSRWTPWLTVEERLLSDNSNTYYQQIAGANQTFVSSGNSQTAGLRLTRVLRRSQDDVFGFEAQLTKRWGASFIEDTEIPQQHRDNTFIEAGLTNRHYFGSAQFDGTLAYRQGVGGLGERRQTRTRPARRTASTWRCSMQTCRCRSPSRSRTCAT